MAHGPDPANVKLTSLDVTMAPWVVIALIRAKYVPAGACVSKRVTLPTSPLNKFVMPAPVPASSRYDVAPPTALHDRCTDNPFA